MKEKVVQLAWETNLKNNIDFEIWSVDEDFILLDNVKVLPAFDHPFKLDVTTFIIISKGITRGKIGLKSYETTAPCVITLPAGEILQHEYISDDFEGLFIVMSKRMTDSLLPDIQERLPIALSVRQNPSVSLNEVDLNLLKTYYYMLKKIVENSENPHRKSIIQHLMLAFYFHSSSWLHKNQQQENLQIKQNECVERFLKLVEKYYKIERQVGFYAEKLHITPKYLSQIIKANTGKSANNCIDDYVILEAKAFLKSSKLTIQQISDEFNFSDQSVFGKYFKRIVGISPKEYRED
ncbi:MAG: helix-turn-helix domain-containing protein [Paludibacter sp.]|nr:helix-turn-helix domain-containing protein [Paludibacter sp.]